MKKINAFTLCFIHIGCYMGAGFVSGQELWQFFGSFGVWGYAGFVLAAALFVLLGYMLMRLTQLTDSEEVDYLLVPWKKWQWLRVVCSWITPIFLFCVVVIMTAGVGALGTQVFHIPYWLGSAVFTIGICILAVFGVEGMVNAFSGFIPLLVIVTIGFAIASWTNFDTGLILTVTPCNDNPLMPNWVIAALTFVAYNLFASIGILVPVGKLVQKKSTALGGMVMSGFGLIAVAACVLTSVIVYPPARELPLPMVGVGSALRPFLGTVYGIMLFMAMFCNSLASLVAFMTHMKQQSRLIQQKEKLVLVVLGSVSWGCSLFGFADIIGVIYPVFGYISILFIGTMILHYLQLVKNKKLKA